MHFDSIELAADELRNEPWVTPVSMNADPAVRAYLAATSPPPRKVRRRDPP